MNKKYAARPKAGSTSELSSSPLAVMQMVILAPRSFLSTIAVSHDAKA
jgi:hypothetical protein